MESGLDGRNNDVRDQVGEQGDDVSMESGLDGRNNQVIAHVLVRGYVLSQWSPA